MSTSGERWNDREAPQSEWPGMRELWRRSWRRERGATDVVPPRVDQLSNGWFVGSRGGLLYTPDSAVMVMLTAESGGRVRYVEPQHVRSVLEDGVTHKPVYLEDYQGYVESVLAPFYWRLSTEYSGATLALQPRIASINGTLESPNLRFSFEERIHDVTEFVKLSGEGETELFSFEIYETGATKVQPTIAKLAYNLGMGRNVDDDIRHRAVFPAILVYDTAAMHLLTETGSLVEFSRGAKPTDALLGIYVLPCPLDITWTN